MLLLYYNVNDEKFYWKIAKNYFATSHEIGYVNSFNHILIEKFHFLDNGIVTQSEFSRLLNKKRKDRDMKFRKKKRSFKNRLINFLVSLLNKF